MTLTPKAPHIPFIFYKVGELFLELLPPLCSLVAVGSLAHSLESCLEWSYALTLGGGSISKIGVWQALTMMLVTAGVVICDVFHFCSELHFPVLFFVLF